MSPKEGLNVVVQPNVVIYSAQLGAGVAIIEVSFTRLKPYVLSYYQTSDQKLPLSQDISDLVSYVEDACKRVGRTFPLNLVS